MHKGMKRESLKSPFSRSTLRQCLLLLRLSLKIEAGRRHHPTHMYAYISFVNLKIGAVYYIYYLPAALNSGESSIQSIFIASEIPI